MSIEDPHVDTAMIGRRWYQEHGKEWEQSQPDYYSVPASFNYDTNLNSMATNPQPQQQQPQQPVQNIQQPQPQPQQILPQQPQQQPQPIFTQGFQNPMQDQMRINQLFGLNQMASNGQQQLPQQQPQQQAYYPYRHQPWYGVAQNWPQAAQYDRQSASVQDANDPLWQKFSQWDPNAALKRRRPRLKVG